MGMLIAGTGKDSDFEFKDGRSSPFVIAPPTPQRFGNYYLSAPTSPTHLSQFNRQFDDFLIVNGRISDGSSPKSPEANTHFEDDFAFDVRVELGRSSLSAEELFDGGVIRPLKLPSRLPPTTHGARLEEEASSEISSPNLSPILPGSNRHKIPGASSTKQRKGRLDPSSTAVQNTHQRERGQERNYGSGSSRPGRRGTRSLSPFRVSDWEEDQQNSETEQSSLMTNSKPSKLLSKCSKKWRLKDLFLFRSASEGRATERDPLKKYTAALKNSTVRATDSPGSGSGSSEIRGRASAHELHYTLNRAVSEDLKKKTFLPYKQGILGRLAFNPAVHALANGFGFSRK